MRHDACARALLLLAPSRHLQVLSALVFLQISSSWTALAGLGMLEVRLQLADLSAVLHGSQLQGHILLVLLVDLIAELQDLAICLARRRLAGRGRCCRGRGR